jgi:hypothetical protein
MCLHWSTAKNIVVVERNWQIRLATGNSLGQHTNLGQRRMEAVITIVRLRRDCSLKYCNRFWQLVTLYCLCGVWHKYIYLLPDWNKKYCARFHLYLPEHLCPFIDRDKIKDTGIVERCLSLGDLFDYALDYICVVLELVWWIVQEVCGN